MSDELTLFYIVYFGILSFFLNFVVSIIAINKGRNGFLWFIFSVFITPYIALFLLLLFGETRDKRREKIFEEEEFKSEYANKNRKQEIVKQLNPNAKTLNDLYSKN